MRRGHPSIPFLSGEFHTTQFRSGCVPPRWVGTIFRSSGACPPRRWAACPALRRWGGAARKRRRQYSTPDSRRHRTSVRLTRSSPARLHGRMHASPISPHGAEQGSTPVGGSTTTPRQPSRGAAWWDGPGPALPRGPSLDGLKTTVSLYGRSWPGGEAVRAHPHQTVRS